MSFSLDGSPRRRDVPDIDDARRWSDRLFAVPFRGVGWAVVRTILANNPDLLASHPAERETRRRTYVDEKGTLPGFSPRPFDQQLAALLAANVENLARRRHPALRKGDAAGCLTAFADIVDLQSAIGLTCSMALDGADAAPDPDAGPTP